MAPSDLPEPDASFELRRFVGAWFILVSNDEFWRERSHPRVDYAEAGGRLSVQRRYREAGLLGRRARVSAELDTIVRPGEFETSRGPLGLERVRWSVPLLDPGGQWAVVFRARSRLGAAAGLDLHTRAPSVEQRLLDEVLERVRAHAFLGGREGPRRRCEGLFAPTQDWRPPRPYRL